MKGYDFDFFIVEEECCGWMVYETSITGEVSREKCFYSVTNFCFGGLPLLGGS